MNLPSRNLVLVVGTTLFLALACVALLLFVVTKAGLVRMPGFVQWYYGPRPSRIVNAPPITPEQFQERLEKRLNTEARSGKNPPYFLTISEQELTAVLKTVSDNALRDRRWQQVSNQIVVRPTDFEILSEYARGIIHLDLLIRFVPEISGEELHFRPTSVQFGDFQVPATFAQRALSVLFDRDLGTWRISFGTTRITALELRNGAIILTLTSST